ncbi:lipoyl domain-containing protein [Galactobacter valiniphilus]|uniref:lipoyl domain-containing protein n=1 Tax=Galactobacter valiniphilus TaxID=2676122 RepID=UPI00373655D1
MTDIVLTPEFLADEDEADLVSWLVADGTSVAVGDMICQLETAKLVTDFPSPAAGVLRHRAEEGDVVNAGETIGVVE